MHNEKRDCIFCKIAKKEISSKIVFEDDEVLAFEDINPQAPVHIIIIPKTHLDKLSDIREDGAQIAGRLVLAANKIAEEKKVARSGYRIVVNNGQDAGQAVMHLHLHLLGARAMKWPPG